MSSKMPTPRRIRAYSDQSCCCASHQYLCPTHRNETSEDSLWSKMFCWLKNYKGPIGGLIVFIGGILLANYVMKQNNLLNEMQLELQKLKEVVDSKEQINFVEDIVPETIKEEDDVDIKAIIRKEIDAYDADKIARVDYALESAGGRILSILTTKPYVTDQSILSKAWNFMMTTICKDGNADSARPIIQPRMAPGECWSFQGSQGAVIIKLLAKIYITGVTVEHIPAAISPSIGITSAPKVFNLWGLKCKDDPNAFLFGEFTYKNDSTPIQYYDVQHKSETPYDIVLVKILSNWGNQKYTCVYRVRIHGVLYEETKHYHNKIENM